MTLALAETGLVHVEVLVEPRGLEDRPADGRVDTLDRVVVGLHEVGRDVDVSGEEGGDHALLVVGEELVGHRVEAGLATAGHRGTGPVVVTDKVDPVGRRGLELERADRDSLADVGTQRVERRVVVLEVRDRVEVMLGEEEAAQRAVIARVGFLEVDGRVQIVLHVDLVDDVPADGADAFVIGIDDVLPGELVVVHRGGSAIGPLEVRLQLDVDFEPGARGVGPNRVVTEGRHLLREVGLPVAIAAGQPQGPLHRRVHLRVREGVREEGVHLVGSLPVGDDHRPAGRARLRLVLDVEQERFVVDRRRAGRHRRRSSRRGACPGGCWGAGRRRRRRCAPACREHHGSAREQAE